MNKRKLTDYIWNWKFNSLFVKTLGQLCLLVMVPLCGVIGLSYFMYNNMRNEEQQKRCEEAMNDIAVKWERIQDECEQQFSFFSFDSEVELFIYDHNLKSAYYDLQNVKKLIGLPTYTRSYITNMMVYSFYNDSIIDKNGIKNLKIYEDDRKVIDEIISLNKDKGIMMYGETSQAKSLYFFWKFGERKKEAIFYIDLSVSRLLEYMDFQEYAHFFIINSEEIILSDNYELVGQSVSDIEQYSKEIDLKDYYITSRFLDKDIEVMCFWEKNQIHTDLGIIGRIMVYFIILMFFVTMGLAMWISGRLYRPFREILYFIRKNDSIQEQDDGFEGKNELEYILRSIEKKAYFDDDISREMTKRLELLKKAQAIALQSQINPHFINNTLEIISYMVISRLGRKNEVSEMVKALADMLRDSLGNTEALVPISEEVIHCEKYIKIQSIRYENRFDVTWDIEPDVYDCKIIRIVFQPIIENAIYHGIKHLSAKGIIKITARSTGDKIKIEITDNGLGMTEEKKEELYRRMNQEMIQESNHIGLANVYQRLKLYYGEECKMQIESKLGAGTSIIILIPCQV